MHAPRVSAVMTMAQLAALVLAAPVTNAVLATRSQYCANAPQTVAGTMLNGRDMAPKNLASVSHAYSDTANQDLTPRAGPQNVLWCAPGSETYILISISSTVDATDSLASTLENILIGAATAIYNHVMAVGDGTIGGGKFQWPLGEFSLSQMLFLKVWNANNHQVTWGVLHAAIAAMVDYMNSRGWGVGHFDIYDGGVRVAYGLLT